MSQTQLAIGVDELINRFEPSEATYLDDPSSLLGSSHEHLAQAEKPSCPVHGDSFEFCSGRTAYPLQDHDERFSVDCIRIVTYVETRGGDAAGVEVRQRSLERGRGWEVSKERRVLPMRYALERGERMLGGGSTGWATYLA